MAAPTANGSFNGEVKQVTTTSSGGQGNRKRSKTSYYMWDEAKGEWISPQGSWHAAIAGENKREFAEIYAEQQLAIKNGENPAGSTIEDKTVKLNAGPIDGGKVDGKTQKWPNDAIESTTDYVFFQFGKYIPPFSQDAQSGSGSTFSKRAGYVSSAERLKVDPYLNSIMLPIPQDLGNEIQQGWQGKSFSGLGRAAISAGAGGSFNNIIQKSGDFTGNIKAIQDALTSMTLNMIPGVGGNLDVNDISGATRGVVLNPNAELLYDSPEMREIGMSFKMVPKNAAEAKTIRAIIKTFRRAALPQWGGTEDLEIGTQEEVEQGKALITDNTQRDNFIRVPRLCKFTFMHGSSPHEWITQFKPCAISNVSVNYTPDGTFATYSDGSPVATEIRLSFQETKLIFEDEVDQGF